MVLVIITRNQILENVIFKDKITFQEQELR
jgi:hypothetical protein